MKPVIHSRRSSRSDSGNLYLRGDIKFDHESPLFFGTYGELFTGRNEAAGRVALKRLRIRTEDDRQLRLEQTLNEALVWRALTHPNVLNFLGVLFESREVYLVSPFLSKGSLPSYVTAHPDVDRATLLREAAEGLAYLHSQKVVHGDFKGSNIVVDVGPRAAICDFGLSKISSPFPTESTGGIGTIRWQSPEIMEGGPRSYDGDVYAFGMTVYEILTGNIPFHTLGTDSEVILAVVTRDQRPLVSTDSFVTLWSAAQRCWTRFPQNRPWMTEVLSLLSPSASPDRALEVSIPPRPPSTTFDSETYALTSLAPTSSICTLKMTWKRRVAIVYAESQKRLQALGVSVPMYSSDVDWAELRTLKGHTDQVTTIAFSLDGSQLASGCQDSTVQLWDAMTGAKLARLLGHSLEVWSIAFSPDGLRLASGSEDWTVRVWDTKLGVQLAILEGHANLIKTVSFSPDGSRLASGSFDTNVRVWNTSDWEVKVLRGHMGRVRAVAFSPDGSRLMSGSDDQTVGLWDVASGANLAILRGHRNWVTTVAFSSNGSRMASGSYDRTLRLWTAQGEEVATLRGHTDWVTTIAFSPDGSRLASGSDDGRVRVWDGDSGQKAVKMRGLSGAIKTIAFSPDGLQLAAGSEGGTVRGWDAVLGTKIAKLRGHSRWVSSVAFSPDGSRLASGSGDGTVRLWRTGKTPSTPISPNTPRWHEVG